jgi:HAD superfamily hydrolase (TIGR01509 family)
VCADSLESLEPSALDQEEPSVALDRARFLVTMATAPRQIASAGPAQAVIFDLDGVLLDSEPVWVAVLKDLLARCGRQWDLLDQTAFSGGDNSRQWAAQLRRLARLNLTEDEIIRWVTAALLERYAARLPLVPGAEETLARLAARFRLGLASSSPPPVISFVLAQSGLGGYLQAWVSSDEVARGKPAPDVYLEACRRLQLAPSCAVAVEDSVIGVEAARAAGLKVIAVASTAETGNMWRNARHATEVIARAHAVVSHVKDLDAELVETVLRSSPHSEPLSPAGQPPNT